MKRPVKIIIRVIVILLSLITLFPFYMMLIMGTHVSEDLLTSLQLLPGDYLMVNLQSVLKTNFGLFYWNSFYIAVISTAGCVLVSALAGFAFAKYQFKFKRTLFIIVLATLMIPMQLGLVGLVMQLKTLGLMNTHFALIVPPMANAFYVFWMTQYIGSAVPTAVLESARIDGYGDLRIFGRIVFPMIRPATITVFLLSFLGSWNNYLTPLVVLNKEEKYTIPMGITLFSTTYRNDYAASTLALCLATLPIILLFAFGSKYLIQGLSGGSVKE
ncbi:MAG: carbohydrate ABC transporter permease [Massiliimalia sp.]|jgi:cellobiose transport system permease protein